MILPKGTASSPHSALDILRNNILFMTSDRKDQATPVPVEYFDAQSTRPGIKLLWCVFSDKDVDGFRIYRMARNDSYLFVVNRRGLIPAWHQSYLDNELSPSTTYRYVLGVVFSDGSEFLSQPVEATSEGSHSMMPASLVGSPEIVPTR
jgi:hypothetical protein